MTGTEKPTLLKRIFADRRGNFGMIAAITVPLCIMAGGIVIDTTNSTNMRVRMQAAADSAALATTTGLVEEELTVGNAKSYARRFFRSQLLEDFPDFDSMVASEDIQVEQVQVNHQPVFRVTVAVEAKRAATPATRLFGENTVSVSVLGRSEAALNATGAISMSFVLDRSGSMSWDDEKGMPKIVALKLASKALLKQFEEMDPDNKFVRLGGSSYREYMAGSTPMNWGTGSIKNFIEALPGEGGTESSAAFNWAYKAVSNANEAAQHQAVNGQDPVRAILFLTDGDNNQTWSDDTTKSYCDQAKNDGITIFAVAFAAPAKGESLLRYCATSPDHFFYADNGQELIKNFKEIGELAAKQVSRLTR